MGLGDRPGRRARVSPGCLRDDSRVVRQQLSAGWAASVSSRWRWSLPKPSRLQVRQQVRQQVQAGRQSPGLTVSGTLERGSARDDAVSIANALNPCSGVIALTPLDDASAVTSTLIQTAQTPRRPWEFRDLA